MIADMFSNEKLNPVVSELSSNNSITTRGRKPNIYLVFITQSYFAVPKSIKLNAAH